MPPSPVSSQLKELLKTCLSQIYIKLTWSNDDPLKCFCLKCHIWWEINQTKFPFGVYRSVSVLFNFFLIVMQNVLSFFSRLSCVPNDRSISNFYGFVSLCIWWITLPATVLLAKKQFCNLMSPRIHLNLYYSWVLLISRPNDGIGPSCWPHLTAWFQALCTLIGQPSDWTRDFLGALLASTSKELMVDLSRIAMLSA